MADIQSIKARLTALMNRARDAGSSPEEVATCLRKAQAMMEKYGITENDLDDAANAPEFKEAAWRKAPGRKKHDPIVRYCAATVGKYTSVEFWFSPGDDAFKALGLDADVEYAQWLLASLRLFMEDQWETYKKFELGPCSREKIKAERIGFIRGFCAIVCGIMEKHIRAASEGGAKTSDTRALVVRKEGLVKREMERKGIHLRSGRSHAGRGHGTMSGQSAGAAAGKQFSFGRGVGKSYAAIGKR